MREHILKSEWFIDKSQRLVEKRIKLESDFKSKLVEDNIRGIEIAIVLSILISRNLIVVLVQLLADPLDHLDTDRLIIR